MSKHTPGPWVVGEVSRREFGAVTHIGTRGNRMDVCEVYGSTDEEPQANARLIAAAPAMLQALKMIDGQHQLNGINHEISTALNIARDVIATVEGIPSGVFKGNWEDTDQDIKADLLELNRKTVNRGHDGLEIMPRCAVCDNRKQPRGRSAPLGAVYCHPEECEGYNQDPQPSSYWSVDEEPLV